MDADRVSFITCVNDPEEYAECRLYLAQLSLPPGMVAELLPVEGAPSMAAGYNFARQQSTAKYKVYLHQDLLLTNRQALMAMLDIFRGDESVGLIGLAGAKSVPFTGIWWQADSFYLHLAQTRHLEKIELAKRGEIRAPYEDVMAVDGMLMFTQHDLPWREDLFAGWHFYDVAQSLEFRKAGYRVVVPRQEAPWCLHECGDKGLGADYHRWRQVFCAAYGEMLGRYTGAH